MSHKDAYCYESAVTLKRTLLHPGCIKRSNGVDRVPQGWDSGLESQPPEGSRGNYQPRVSQIESARVWWERAVHSGEMPREEGQWSPRLRVGDRLGHQPQEGSTPSFLSCWEFARSWIGMRLSLAGGGKWGMLLWQDAEGLRRRGFWQEAKPPSREWKQTREKRTLSSSAIFLISESLFLSNIEYCILKPGLQLHSFSPLLISLSDI